MIADLFQQINDAGWGYTSELVRTHREPGGPIFTLTLSRTGHPSRTFTGPNLANLAEKAIDHATTHPTQLTLELT